MDFLKEEIKRQLPRRREMHRPLVSVSEVKVAQSSVTLCDPVDCAVHGIL